jgi:hypothetical protein
MAFGKKKKYSSRELVADSSMVSAATSLPPVRVLRVAPKIDQKKIVPV